MSYTLAICSKKHPQIGLKIFELKKNNLLLTRISHKNRKIVVDIIENLYVLCKNIHMAISKEYLEKYWAILSRYCVNRLIDKSYGIDAVSESFRKFYSKNRNIEKEAIFSYLKRIAKNVCINMNNKYIEEQNSNNPYREKKGIIHNDDVENVEPRDQEKSLFVPGKEVTIEGCLGISIPSEIFNLEDEVKRNMSKAKYIINNVIKNGINVDRDRKINFLYFVHDNTLEEIVNIIKKDDKIDLTDTRVSIIIKDFEIKLKLHYIINNDFNGAKNTDNINNAIFYLHFLHRLTLPKIGNFLGLDGAVVKNIVNHLKPKFDKFIQDCEMQNLYVIVIADSKNNNKNKQEIYKCYFEKRNTTEEIQNIYKITKVKLTIILNEFKFNKKVIKKFIEVKL
ncbi:MAG: hypothetical protein FWD14_06405 [Treponema sp.]|nr:hypothetical protein [Treponema sp.]